MKLLLLILSLFIINLEAKDKPSTGLKIEPLELYSSIKQAAPYIADRSGALPSYIDLSDKMPPAGYQGKQGSCTAWSSTYAVKSYHEYIERQGRSGGGWGNLVTREGFNPKTVFSPAFVYNHINDGKDKGATLYETLSFLVSRGAVPWENMPYDPKNYSKKPSPKLDSIALKYVAKDFYKVNFADINEIKSQLYKGNPIMTGILVSTDLLEYKGDKIYKSANGKSMGGHAVTIVGYDDNRKALKFLNSWGQDWGDNGYGYIDYKYFTKVARIAYVMIDKVDNAKFRNLDMSIEGDFRTSRISPPSEINATKGSYSDKVVLTWEKIEGAVGYEIHRAFPDSKEFILVGLSRNTSFIDTGVIVDIAYSYRITSITENTISEKSTTEVIGYASTEKKGVPPKVAGLKASNGIHTNKVTLEWEPIENISSYNVYKWNDRKRKFVLLSKVKGNSYTDKSPSRKGEVETYTVAALEKNKVGTFSDSAIGRIDTLKRPEPPSDITISQGIYSDRIELKWSKVNGATGYLVYKYEGDEWKPLGIVDKEYFIDNDPGRGKQIYTVTVKSKNEQWSDFSDKVVGYADTKLQRSGGKLEPPEDFTVELDKKKEELNFKWKKQKEAEEYTIYYKKHGDSNWKLLSRAYGDDFFTTALPEKEALLLFTITSKKIDGQESGYSNVESVVYSTPKKSPTRRSFTDDTKIEVIQGTWTGMVWDGATGVKNINMEITSKEDSTIEVKINKKIYKGKYITESPEIDLDDKVKIKLTADDALMVELKDKSLVSQNVEVSFLRE
ncbi:MAG: cysteine protease [Leptospiraceae bacterium]|nr:cysteine protease [Leptospiraceae bacterium]